MFFLLLKKKLHTTLCYFVSVVNFFTSPVKALLLLYCIKNLLHFAVYDRKLFLISLPDKVLLLLFCIMYTQYMFMLLFSDVQLREKEASWLPIDITFIKEIWVPNVFIYRSVLLNYKPPSSRHQYIIIAYMSRFLQ